MKNNKILPIFINEFVIFMFIAISLSIYYDLTNNLNVTIFLSISYIIIAPLKVYLLCNKKLEKQPQKQEQEEIEK